MFFQLGSVFAFVLFPERSHDTWPLRSFAGKFEPSGRKKSTKKMKMTKPTTTAKLNPRTALAETLGEKGLNGKHDGLEV